MNTVAVSYLEWIRWVATGWFRCADRMVWLEGPEDQQGMDFLMDRTPDLKVSDDQGYVIARLKSDAFVDARTNLSARTIAHLYLSVASVSTFHPLSSRGARLLEADAQRAAVRLSEPIFEKLWADWRDRRLEDEAHQRGLSLCVAFGLQVPNLNLVPPQVRNILSGLAPAPNAAEQRDKELVGTRAFGWTAALSVAFIDTQVRNDFKQRSEDAEVKGILKSLKADLNLRRPLFDDEAMVRLAGAIDSFLHELSARPIPIAAMAVVLHYRHLASTEREVVLGALVTDLADIILGDLDNAALCAYFIGRSMENVAVTTLLYQSNPSRYEALAPGKPAHPLEVRALAAAKCEALEETNIQELISLPSPEGGETQVAEQGGAGPPPKVEEGFGNDYFPGADANSSKATASETPLESETRSDQETDTLSAQAFTALPEGQTESSRPDEAEIEETSSPPASEEKCPVVPESEIFTSTGKVETETELFPTDASTGAFLPVPPASKKGRKRS